MNENAKITLAVVGGYVLGRRKKAKLAIGLGLYLAGKKLNIDPKRIADVLMRQLGDSPQLAAVREQAQGQLASVGKVAVGAVVDRGAGHVADLLHDRTERLRNGADDEDEVREEPDEPEEEPPEPAEASEDTEDTGEEEPEEPAPKRRAPQKRRTGSGTQRRAPARRKRTAGSES